MGEREYGNKSISSLKGADRVRKRPEVIFGSSNVEGCQHSFFEILSNSIDEAREGFGNTIEVTRYLDKSIKIKDYGRGIPLDYNPIEKRYNWELVFCEMYAGGKYKNSATSHYEFSLGLNGLGSCATQYSSEYMNVKVWRDGCRHELFFEKGNNVGGLFKEKMSINKTGTEIKWRPDLEVFTDIDIPLEYFQDVLRKQAVVNAGLTFKFLDQTQEGMQEYVYRYDRGIVDYVKEVCAGKNTTSIEYFESERAGRDREDRPEYKVKMQVSFCFTNEVNMLEYYHNSSFLEYGGSPDRAVKNAFTSVIDQYIKQAGKYNKNESKISFQDIQDGLVLISSSFSTATSYENQTKKAINNKFIGEAMTEFLRHNLEVYFIENKAEADKIAQQTLLNKRSRETAERARINLRKKISGGVDITNRVEKFVDCRSRDIAKREVYIVEGDSALGACKMGRDAEFQAIIPVRGKILNCLKSDLDRIFKNDIITDLIKVLGCGVEIGAKGKGGKNVGAFDLDALRWGKVIICTDADVDGFQIRTLILAMIYRLMPTLIREGKVYIAQSPLFEINAGGESLFAYDESEKTQILKGLEGRKHTILRSKGLGENEPEMMWKTTMNPETRRLVKVLGEDAQKTGEVFELLLGDNLAGRKDFIAEKGHEYLDMADVS